MGISVSEHLLDVPQGGGCEGGGGQGGGPGIAATPAPATFPGHHSVITRPWRLLIALCLLVEYLERLQLKIYLR